MGRIPPAPPPRFYTPAMLPITFASLAAVLVCAAPHPAVDAMSPEPARSSVQSAPPRQPPPSPPSPQQPPQAQRAPAPSLRVEPPAIELGRVAPSTNHPVSFTLRNVSAQPLVIRDAKPSCKCTTLDSLAGRAIAPGETVKLDATFDAPTVPGEKDAHIFIAVDGVQRPVIATIKAVIVMPVEAVPPFVDIRGGNLRATATIDAVDGKPFRIRSAGGAPPRFVDASGVEIAPPSEPQSRYVLIADFSMVSPGDLMQYWVVETDRDDCPIVPVQVRHEMTGLKFDPTSSQRRWLFGESLVNAGRLDVGEVYEGVVEITAYDPPAAAGAAPVPPGWGDVRQVRSLSPMANVELTGTETRGEKVSLPFRFTPAAGAAGKCIYVPVAVTTATGEGRFFVTASVSTRVFDGAKPLPSNAPAAPPAAPSAPPNAPSAPPNAPGAPPASPGASPPPAGGSK